MGRLRYCGAPARVPLDVLSTNIFHPAVEIAHIRHGCAPRRREDAVIVDGELELQVLARIRVPDPQDGVMLLGVAIEPLFGGGIIKQPIAFDDMQGLRVRRAICGPFKRTLAESFGPNSIYPGKCRTGFSHF